MDDRRARPSAGEDDVELVELDDVFADLRTAFVRPADSAVATQHLALMDAALRQSDDPLLAPVVASIGESAHRLRRKLAVAAAGIAAVVVGVGGLGYAGALPGPVQDAIASVVEPLGIDIPHGDDAPASGERNDSGDPSSGAGNGAGSDEVPGQAGSTPGESGETPSQPPGQSGSAPGQSGQAPGQSGVAPGQSGEAPGQSGSSPGQSGSAPGQSGQAPGQSGEPPGNSGNAPGQGGTNPGNAGGNSAGGAANGNGNGNGASNGNQGGNSAEAPGHNK